MSTSQRKKTLISLDPRAVFDRTVVMPGTSRMASSIGRVTCSICMFTGAMPLSTRMTMRGKSVCGKIEIGSLSMKMTPAREKLRTIRIMALPCASTKSAMRPVTSLPPRS